MKVIYPYPGYLWHWRTALPEVPGTGMNVVQNFQNFRVVGRPDIRADLSITKRFNFLGIPGGVFFTFDIGKV